MHKPWSNTHISLYSTFKFETFLKSNKYHVKQALVNGCPRSWNEKTLLFDFEIGMPFNVRRAITISNI